jgi:hypothetical protein
MANKPIRSSDFLNDTTFSLLKDTFSPDHKTYNTVGETTGTIYKHPLQRTIILTPKLHVTWADEHHYYLQWVIPCVVDPIPGQYKYDNYDSISSTLRERLVYSYWMLSIQCFSNWGRFPKHIIRIILNYVWDQDLLWHQYVTHSCLKNSIFSTLEELNEMIGFNRICEWFNSLSISPESHRVPQFTRIQKGNNFLCSLLLEKDRNMVFYNDDGNIIYNGGIIYNPTIDSVPSSWVMAKMLICPNNLWKLNDKSGVRIKILQAQLFKSNNK